ncbi:hypothetical protein SELMODRAFT_8086, partial [Selaginella moellendorffii]
LISSNNKAYLYLSIDCNLLIYVGEKILWSTNTSGKGINCILRLQEDGNLVLYSYNWKVVWSSDTYCTSYKCYKDTYLIMQNDCNLVLYIG